MFTILSRFAWFISFLSSLCLSFLFFPQKYYFFLGWWIFVLVFWFLIKRVFFSEEFILSQLSQGYSLDNEIPPPKDVQLHGLDRTNSEEDSVDPIKKETLVEISSNYSNNNNSDEITPSLQERIAEKEISIGDSLNIEQEPIWIVSFFADRPLAKIGGILLFLWVLYFFSLIWTEIGSVGKILIWFIFGFSFYSIWVWMDKKWNIWESRTLLGVWIAVNALTILSGRWLLGWEDRFFSDTITLIFLLLNTILAVVTALVYGSRTFLVFSFLFGYIIPFISGGSANTPYTLLWYNTLFTWAWYILASYLIKSDAMNKENASWLMKVLIIGSFIVWLSNIYQISSFPDLIGYLIITLIILTFGAIVDMKYFASRFIPLFMISGYITLFFLMFWKSEFGNPLFFIIGIIPLFCFLLFQIVTIGFTFMLSWLLFVPLIFALALICIFGISALISVIPIILILYIISVILTSNRIPSQILNFLFFGLAGFLFLSGISIHFNSLFVILEFDRLIISVSSIVFFLFSAGFALHNKNQNLSLIATISTILILSVVLSPLWSLSWLIWGIFISCALVVPFLSGKKTPWIQSVIHIVLLSLFIVLEIAFLGQDIWFLAIWTTAPGLITLGFIYLILSIGITFYALLLVRVSTGVTLWELWNLPEASKNITYGIFSVPLSLFSLSIAVIFSDNPWVVTTVWVVESTILAFLYRKVRIDIILGWSIILLLIWLAKLIPFYDSIHRGDFLLLVPVSIIMASLCLGVNFIKPRKIGIHFFYDFIHVAGMIAVLGAFSQIIPVTPYGWSILSAWFLILFFSYIYKKAESDFLALWLLLLIGVEVLFHIFRIWTDQLSMSLFPLLIQLSGMLLVMYAAWIFLSWHKHGILALIITSIGAVIITSLYVNAITHNVFAVTIYLTAIASLFITRWIYMDRSYYRTIGLYIGIFVLAKIFIYDLWVGFDNVTIRVLALMITGWVMIALSQLYGKSVKRTWSDEFSSSNFAWFVSFASLSSSENYTTEKQDIPFTDEVAQHLKRIDISDISLIRLVSTHGEVFVSKRAWLIRMAQYILQEMHKAEFQPGELMHVYLQVMPYLKSNLAKDDLEELLQSVQSWITLWGRVETVYKK